MYIIRSGADLVGLACLVFRLLVVSAVVVARLVALQATLFVLYLARCDVTAGALADRANRLSA